MGGQARPGKEGAGRGSDETVRWRMRQLLGADERPRMESGRTRKRGKLSVQSVLGVWHRTEEEKRVAG